MKKTRGTKRVLEYARLTMGFANVRAGTRVLKAGAGAGQPVDKLCRETASGVFEREWTGAAVRLDTRTNTATITMKVQRKNRMGDAALGRARGTTPDGVR